MKMYTSQQVHRVFCFRSPPVRLAVSLLAVAVCGAVYAQAPAKVGDAEVRRQIETLRAEQARIAELQMKTEASIRALEASLGIAPPPAGGPGPDPVKDVNPVARDVASAAPPVPAPAPQSAPPSRLAVAGDLRLRVQRDSSNDHAPDRHSGQVRGRLGITYAVNDIVSVGARMVTGDFNDPNSVDVQLSNFSNKFQTSLDLAYAKLDYGSTQFYGGKIPQPFVRTDLVWDGDVTPQGIGMNYKLPLAGGGAFKANALYYIIDEQAVGSESTMAGAQFVYETPALGAWKFDAAAAYYHYSLGSLAGADAGDFRTNLRKPNGTYLSEFHLGDVIAGATYTGFGERWPLRIVGDYVHNFGAATDADTGYGLDVLLGRASKVGDWRVGYGYAVAETDAVFSAFSHDNTSLATNYRQHMLSADYVLFPSTTLSATWAHYKPDNAYDTPAFDSRDWLDRFRLALLVTF
ncbi:MAG: putative porin [Proteobacteria bacterium]|uniref:putative porin n=1 Tax=Rudaea sp. TaxID=2136325 RepID=UPI0032200833|nr:putative porin [Pseudomonadota bacterium]